MLRKTLNCNLFRTHSILIRVLQLKNGVRHEAIIMDWAIFIKFTSSKV